MVALNIYPRRQELQSLLELYPPQTANKFLPNWYKNQKLYKKFDVFDKDVSLDAKRCPAIIEELTRGIVIPSWSDFYIYKNIDDDRIHWVCEVGKTWNIKHWSWIEDQKHMQIEGMGLNSIKHFGVFKLICPYLFETEEGYGLQFRDPFYHHRNNIRILPGYVETDIWHETNLPFEFLENIDELEEFTLMIKAGEPLFIVDIYKKEQKVDLKLNNFSKEKEDLHYKNSALMNSIGEDWNRYKKNKN